MAQSKIPPSNLTATPTSPYSVRLNWQNNGDYYQIKIYYGLSGQGVNYLTSIDGSETNYSVGNLQASTAYDFKISVVYFDLTESSLIGPVSATTYPVLSPPQSLQGFPHGNCIDLTWNSISLSGDYIEIWRDAGAGYSLLSTTWLNQEFYRDTTATAAQQYKYKLRVKSGSYYSDYSSELIVTQYGAPNAPSNGVQLKAFSDSVIIGWQAPTSGAVVDGYIILDSSDTEIVRVPSKITSAYLSGLNSNTSYTFKVKAYNGAGSSSAITINTTTADWYSEKKLDYLARNSKLQLVFAFIIETGSMTYCWTSEAHSAFDSYTCYHGTLKADNFSYQKVIQPFYKPGLVGITGEVSIFNMKDGKTGVFDSLLNSVNFLGAKCRLVFGDRSFSSIDDFFTFSGGLISEIKIEQDIIQFSFLDPFSCLDSNITLNKNANDEYIPVLYGYNWITGYVVDASKKKIKFVDHAVKDITAVQINGVNQITDNWKVNLQDGAIVFGSSVTLTDKDIITAYVAGKRNGALELINSPADIIIDLLGNNISLFDIPYLVDYKRNAGQISFSIDYTETYIEVIKRLLSSTQAGVYTAGDKARIKYWQTKSTGISISADEYSKLKTEIKSEDQIYQVKVGYALNSDIPEEQKKIYVFGSTSAIGEKIELSIYGSEAGADSLANTISNYAQKTAVELELPFLMITLEPLEIITTPSGDMMIEKIENNLIENKSMITGRKQ